MVYGEYGRIAQLQLREAGSGYVIRNDLGEFVEAGCRKYPHIDDPFINELLASRDGLEAAARLGIPKIIIQTDCSSLAELWQDERQTRSEGAHVLGEMKMMCVNFQEVKLLFLGRDAKEALSVVDFVCFDVIPGFLTELIQPECSHYPV
jgi:hypothetical protein